MGVLGFLDPTTTFGLYGKLGGTPPRASGAPAGSEDSRTPLLKGMARRCVTP